MDWGWIAPTAVGILNIGFTAWNSHKQRDDAKKTSDILAELKREDRRQDRWDRVYPPLIAAIADGTGWMHEVVNVYLVDRRKIVYFRDDHGYLKPAFPEFPDSPGEVLYKGFKPDWSPRVRHLVELWSKECGAFRGLLGTLQGHFPPPMNWTDPREVDASLYSGPDFERRVRYSEHMTDALRQDWLRAMDLMKQISDQIALERTGKHDGSMSDEDRGAGQA